MKENRKLLGRVKGAIIMDVMASGRLIFGITMSGTVALFVSSAFINWPDMWGINHLMYLPDTLKLSVLGIGVLAFALLYLLKRAGKLGNLVNGAAELIWSGSIWPRVLIAVLFTLLFIMGKVQTFFLGDGYSMIAVMGQGNVYLKRWTVPGTTQLFRLIQPFFGGYTESSATATFQFLSILSGSVTVYNLVHIAGRISKERKLKVLALISMLFSGAMLLFFGYVEFYPLYWAVTTLFISLSLRYIETGRGLVLVFVTFAAAAAAHLQALILVGGVFVIFWHRVLSENKKQISVRALKFGYVTFLLLAVVSLYSIRFLPEFYLMKLPFFTSAEQVNEFSVYGMPYLTDVLNEVLLVFPGFLVLLSLGAFARPVDIKSHFLALCALGALGWVVLIDPTLGIGRDWDIVAFPVFVIGLFGIWGVSRNLHLLSGFKMLLYGVCCLMITASFICVNANVKSSESRFLDLVRRYGSKDYTGWSALAYYYYTKGDDTKMNAVSREMEEFFPQRNTLLRGKYFLKSGDYDSAITVGLNLLRSDRTNHEIYLLLGNAYKFKKDYPAAEKYFREALKIMPSSRVENELALFYLYSGELDKGIKVFKRIRRSNPKYVYAAEGLGLAYYKMGQYDSAIAMTDTLFRSDRNSPGGHLLGLYVALRTDRLIDARHHYREYVKHGQKRPEYDWVVEKYSTLR